ncbi:hypothetical protein [Dactylosporangium sp. NPDC000521]|uniref:hypothetical protein n=1 Tax=Dactylosporangium sp. NPDC000521 TaxID=3363975 RepID=UPI00368A7B6D
MVGPEPETAAMGTGELLLEAYAADEQLQQALKQFIDRHIMLSFVAHEGVVPDGQDPEMGYIRELRRRLQEFKTEFYENHLCNCKCHKEKPAEDPAAEAGRIPSARAAEADEIPPAQFADAGKLPDAQVAGAQTAEAQVTEPVRAAATPPARPPLPAWRGPIDELLVSNIGLMYLHGWTVPEDRDDALHRMYVALLRLPSAQREAWTERLRPITTVPDEPRFIVLPGLKDETSGPLVPATPAGPSIVAITTHPLDPEVTFAIGGERDLALAQLLHGFGVLVSQVRCLAGVDTRLLDAVTDQTIAKFRGMTNGPAVDRYRNYVLARLRDLAQAGTAGERLYGAVRLDEALRSLVHAPVSADDSWWGALRSASFRLVNHYADLARKAEHRVDVDLLSGAYGEVVESGNSSKDAMAKPGPGRRDGEIAACLRLHLRIDGQQWKGRVQYYE